MFSILGRDKQKSLYILDNKITKRSFKMAIMDKLMFWRKSDNLPSFDSGRDLWKYYQKQIGVNVDGSLYDIREHFQGRDEMGRMRNASADALYMDLIGVLRKKVKHLSKSIEEKIYVHGFLKK